MEALMIADFLINNWDTIGLLVTNVIAYFMKPPRKNNLTRSTDNET